MSTLELTLAVTALANAIASEIPDNDQLALLAAVTDQLSTTLATIAASRPSGGSESGEGYIH